VCGQKSIPSTALIVKGDTTNKGEFPWQVAIYQRRGLETNQLICGGTLISEKMLFAAWERFRNIFNNRQTVLATETVKR
jgi:secreted trypsin-like serine protease